MTNGACLFASCLRFREHFAFKHKSGHKSKSDVHYQNPGWTSFFLVHFAKKFSIKCRLVYSFNGLLLSIVCLFAWKMFGFKLKLEQARTIVVPLKVVNLPMNIQLVPIIWRYKSTKHDAIKRRFKALNTIRCSVINASMHQCINAYGASNNFAFPLERYNANQKSPKL